MTSKEERVWSALKSHWGKKLSRMHANATDREIDLALGDVCDTTARQITYKIMYSADEYINLAL